jgi:hypothetical protein
MLSNKWQSLDSGALKSGTRAEGEPASEKCVKRDQTNDHREQENPRRKTTQQRTTATTRSENEINNNKNRRKSEGYPQRENNNKTRLRKTRQ